MSHWLNVAVAVAVVALLWSGFFGLIRGVTDAAVEAIRFVPSHWLVNGGSFSIHVLTHVVFPVISRLSPNYFARCFDPENDPRTSNTLLMFHSASKGGSVLSMRLSIDLVFHCGLTASMPHATTDVWPPESVIPNNVESEVYLGHSYNGRYDEYLAQPFNQGKKVKCVVMTRNPVDRFISLYKYTRDGGESGLTGYQRTMNEIQKNISQSEDAVKAMVEFAWTAFAKESMHTTHDTLVKSLHPDDTGMLCYQIKYEDLVDDFDEANRKWLRYMGVKESAISALIEVFNAHDYSRRGKGSHASGRLITEEESRILNNLVNDRNGKYFLDLHQQAEDLGYA